MTVREFHDASPPRSGLQPLVRAGQAAVGAAADGAAAAARPARPRTAPRDARREAPAAPAPMRVQAMTERSQRRWRRATPDAAPARPAALDATWSDWTGWRRRRRARCRPTTTSCRWRSCSTRTPTTPTASWPAAQTGGRSKTHHAQQGRAEAPRRRARRLGLGQDDAGAVHHRAAAAARHAGGAASTARATCAPTPIRMSGAPTTTSSGSGAASARSSPMRSTSPSTRRAAPPGRPISITLLPNGINELPEHEQQLLANLSSAALGDMLHLKNSATHQKQSGTLSVALRDPRQPLAAGGDARRPHPSARGRGPRAHRPDAAHGPVGQDPARSRGPARQPAAPQRRAVRGRRREPAHGGAARHRAATRATGRTRLSVIYTGFLGDNENILFWVSQFLSEALRFCQRNPNDELQAVVMFDEADLYIPANSKPATAEPLQSLLKRARSAGLGIMLATQSPGDLDYKSRDQITSWFIGRVREDTALRKLRAAFQSESGLDPARGAAEPDGRRVPSRAGRPGARDEGAALADQRRAGAVRPHRAARARDQGPGREAASAVRYGIGGSATGRENRPNFVAKQQQWHLREVSFRGAILLQRTRELRDANICTSLMPRRIKQVLKAAIFGD